MFLQILLCLKVAKTWINGKSMHCIGTLRPVFSQILLQDLMSYSVVTVITFLWRFSRVALWGYLDSYCCNFLGFLSLLSIIRPNSDLEHPLCNNLRQGNWMMGEFCSKSYRLDNVNIQEFCPCACRVCNNIQWDYMSHKWLRIWLCMKELF